ncbi:hypothetical protein J2X73_003660 [Novosphingobium sp. 1748]|uniref:hypothetical protein n=1 Tax=Novosphingobium sp. 1748 TaxID=2817760 RepID=UPI0028633BDB|nr:hypothetical protein [Novosphingobium sp. 1748]MDR6709271.1 hypothetical protein [Novosphingobium sp. 1748]
MNQSCDNTSPSFSAFTSAEDGEREFQIASKLEEERNRGAERRSIGSQPSEITVLERRVLAHQRILQALIRHLADDNSEILTRLKARFGPSHNLGEHEQDFVSTDHYCDYFIQSIEKEIEQSKLR